MSALDVPREPPSSSPDARSFDALLPAQMATKAEGVGVTKANLDACQPVRAGGPRRCVHLTRCHLRNHGQCRGPAKCRSASSDCIAGLAFSLGLILVIVGGAELFTGNTLIVMAWASRKVSSAALLRNWVIVYAGNFVGALATAASCSCQASTRSARAAVGLTALTIGNAKAGLDFVPAVVLGVMCNALVCLAVWLAFSARTTTDRILAIVPPIAAFVAIGFEHSVANMYFIPEAIAIRAWAPTEFWAEIDRTAADFPNLTVGALSRQPRCPSPWAM